MKNNKGSESSPDSCVKCYTMFLITDKGNPRACHVYEKLGGKNDYKDEIVYVYDYEKGDK